MDNVFIVMDESKAIGVYTSHRKAVQDIIMLTIPFSYAMVDYVYDFGVEFYTFRNKDDIERTYSIQEMTPDKRV